MGGCARARKAAAHDSDYDVHVWQLVADIQYYDGHYGVQEPHYGSDGYQPSLRKIRVGGHSIKIVRRQGRVCGYADPGAGFGNMEG